LLHFLGVRGVGGAVQQVEADTFKVTLVGKGEQTVEPFDFEEQINSFRLFVMVDELRNDLVHELQDFVYRLILFHTGFVFGSNLAGQGAQVLVAPSHQVLACASEAVSEGLVGLNLLGGNHCEH